MDKSTTSSDHDLLIELNTKFGIFMIQNKNDMKDLKDGASTQLQEHENKIKDHEKRINDMEELRDLINPIQVVKDFRSLESEIHDIKVTAKVWRVVAGMFGAALFWFVTKIPYLWGIIFDN